MRIIGGQWRSRVLAAPRGSATRPTSDKLRETLFNVLGPRVDGARFLDLFAGSGAVGLEALSRGAAHVVFVENARPAVAAIRANLAALSPETGKFQCEARGCSDFLRALTGLRPAFDIVFLDPPYEDEDAYRTSLAGLERNGWLAEGAIVVAEHSAPGRRAGAVTSPEHAGKLERYRELVQGDAALSFYRYALGPQPAI